METEDKERLERLLEVVAEYYRQHKKGIERCEEFVKKGYMKKVGGAYVSRATGRVMLPV
jgi:hypothetical protein